MSTFEFDAVMHVGDIAYAGIATNIPILNITSGDEWEFVWDQYFEVRLLCVLCVCCAVLTA